MKEDSFWCPVCFFCCHQETVRRHQEDWWTYQLYCRDCQHFVWQNIQSSNFQILQPVQMVIAIVILQKCLVWFAQSNLAANQAETWQLLHVLGMTQFCDGEIWTICYGCTGHYKSFLSVKDNLTLNTDYLLWSVQLISTFYIFWYTLLDQINLPYFFRWIFVLWQCIKYWYPLHSKVETF